MNADAEQQAKEIGIRNVLIAPITYFAMNRWLQNVAHQLDISRDVVPVYQ